MQNNKIIFGFAGPMSSGKDTAANYLAKKYAGVNYSFSTMLKDVLERYHLEFNRDNLIKISEAMRERFGEDILAKTIAEDVKNDQNKIISISNVRRLADIKFLSDIPGFVLIAIDAEPKIRYERLVKRAEKSDDVNKTYEQFLADQQRSTETTIPEVMSKAQETINNDGTLENLYSQLDELIKKYTQF